MSQENLEIVRGAFEAYNRGDIAAVLEAVDPNIVIVQPLELGGTTQHGHAGVIEALGMWPEEWDEYETDLVETIDAGEHVVVIARQRGRSRATGMELDARFSFLMTLRDEKIAGWRLFAHEHDALEAAELLSE
jgi:ketosteroid isomerase-like protein